MEKIEKAVVTNALDVCRLALNIEHENSNYGAGAREMATLLLKSWGVPETQINNTFLALYVLDDKRFESKEETERFLSTLVGVHQEIYSEETE